MDILGLLTQKNPGYYPLNSLEQQLLLIVSVFTIYLAKTVVYTVYPFFRFVLGCLSSVYLHVKPGTHAILVDVLSNACEDTFFTILNTLDIIATTLWSWPQLLPQQEPTSILFTLKVAYKAIRGHSFSSNQARKVFGWLPETVSRRLVSRECYHRSVSHVSGLSLFDLPLFAKVFLFKENSGQDLDYILARLPTAVSSLMKDEICEEIYTRHATALATIVTLFGLVFFTFITLKLRNHISWVIVNCLRSLWHCVSSLSRSLFDSFPRTKQEMRILKDVNIQTESDKEAAKTVISRLVQTENTSVQIDAAIQMENEEADKPEESSMDTSVGIEEETPQLVNGSPRIQTEFIAEGSEEAKPIDVSDNQLETNDFVELSTENIQLENMAKITTDETRCSSPPILQRIQVYTGRTRNYLSKVSGVTSNTSLFGNGSTPAPPTPPQWTQLTWQSPSLLGQQITQNQSIDVHHMNPTAHLNTPFFEGPLHHGCSIVPTFTGYTSGCAPVSSFPSDQIFSNSFNSMSSLMGQLQGSGALYDIPYVLSEPQTYTASQQHLETGFLIPYEGTSYNAESTHPRNKPRRPYPNHAVQQINRQPFPLPPRPHAVKNNESDIVESTAAISGDQTASSESQIDELQVSKSEVEEQVVATEKPAFGLSSSINLTGEVTEGVDEEMFVYPGSLVDESFIGEASQAIPKLTDFVEGCSTHQNERAHSPSTAHPKNESINMENEASINSNVHETKSSLAITQGPVDTERTESKLEFTFSLSIPPRANSVPTKGKSTDGLCSMIRSLSNEGIKNSRTASEKASEGVEVNIAIDTPRAEASPSCPRLKTSTGERQGLEASIHARRSSPYSDTPSNVPKLADRLGARISNSGLHASMHAPNRNQNLVEDASIPISTSMGATRVRSNDRSSRKKKRR